MMQFKSDNVILDNSSKDRAISFCANSMIPRSCY